MKPKKGRSQYLIDTRMQLSVALSMSLALVALTLVSVISIYVNTGDDLGPSSAEIRRTGFMVTGVYFVLVFVANMICGVMATQRIAGPARVIEKAVRGMRQHDYGCRLKLRDRDHLKSLAAEVAGLRDDIQAAAAERQRLHDAIATAISEGRHDDALRLCKAHSDSKARPDGLDSAAIAAEPEPCEVSG